MNMNMLDCFHNDFCLRLAITLAHFLWQAAAVGVLAGLAGAVLRKSSAPVRYGVFLAALILMAVCPVITFAIIHPSYHVNSTAAGGFAPALSGDAAETIASTASPSIAGKAAVLAKAPPPARALPQGPVENGRAYWKNLPPLVTACYLLGVTLFLLRLLFGLQGALRLRRISQPVADATLLAMLSQRARALGMTFTPAIACCHRVAVPIVVGVLRPMILLPLHMATGLTADQVAAILTHELAHIRRFDPVVNLLQRLIEMFLFYHPAVWYVSRQVRLERENCCDDLTVAAGSERLAYAQSLLHLAQRSLEGPLAQRRLAVAVAAADKPSLLRRRIYRLVGGSVEETRPTCSAPMAMLLLAAIAVVVAAAATGRSQSAASRQAATEPATQPTTQSARMQYSVKLPPGWEKYMSMGEITVSPPFYGVNVDDRFPTAPVIRVRGSIRNLTNWPLSVVVQYDSRQADNSRGTGWGVKYLLAANEVRPIDQLVRFTSVSVPTRFKLGLEKLSQEHDGIDLPGPEHVSGQDSYYALVTEPLPTLPLGRESRQAKDASSAPFELKSLKLEHLAEQGNVATAELVNRTDKELRIGVLLAAGDPTKTDFAIHRNPMTISPPKLSATLITLKPNASQSVACPYAVSPGGMNPVLVYSIVLYDEGFAGADRWVRGGYVQPYYWGWLDLAAAAGQGLAQLPIEVPVAQRANLTETTTTPHFIFRYTKDSYAASHIDKLAQEREAVYAWLSKLFKLELPEKVTIDLYPDMESKGFGSKTTDTPGNTVNNKQIAEVCDETEPLDKYHELTHIFSYYFPNNTGDIRFGLLEGLAATLEDRNYNPASTSHDLRLKLQQGKLQGLDKTLLSEGTSEEVFAAIDFLLKRDTEKFKQLYVRIDKDMTPEKLGQVVREIYGVSMADLEKDWHDFIMDDRPDKSIKAGR